MPAAKSSSSAFSPIVLGHLALIALVVAYNTLRYFGTDSHDRYKCKALLNRGDWLDSKPHANWQPDGCMLHNYTPKETTSCLEGRRLVFIGDSTVRQVFYAVVNTIDPAINDAFATRHESRSVQAGGMVFDFIWDQFLNETHTADILIGEYRGLLRDQKTPQIPSLLVFGTGLHFLRQYPPDQALSLWKANMDRLFTALANDKPLIADEVILLPVEEPVEARLTPERAASLKMADVRRMNEDLAQRRFPDISSAPLPVSIPWVFNKMISDAGEETEDGLHYSARITKIQANILWNLRCNDVLPKKFPLDKTCCSLYPTPHSMQFVWLIVIMLLAPVAMYVYSNMGNSILVKFFPAQEYLPPLAIFGFAIVFIFFGDRTHLFLKSQKQYDAVQFGILSFSALAVGLATMKKPEKGDLGFLNREQTDEWKGWMQVAILIYHYLGASKISGIYNPIRVLVAAYLFMSGYGHFFFYYKKGDFGFARVFSVMVRLNLLTVVLAYVMDTDYLSYYFSPLVSMWFGIIWVTMWAGNQWNKNTYFILAKLALSAALVATFFSLQWPLAAVFGVINTVFRTDWIAREWTFRVTLDLYIVYSGMLAAYAYIKYIEFGLGDRPWWPQFSKGAIVASAITMLGYFVFELRHAKFDYNRWHPYISTLPVLSFVVLRNATPYLRSTSSKFFMYFGTCSLETFIIQFHLWLAADTKGLLVFIPGTSLVARIANFVISSAIFVFLSENVATATGSLTTWLVGKPVKAKPARGAYTPVTTDTESKEVLNVEEDPPKKTKMQRLLAMLATDLRVKAVFIVGLLWVCNLLFPSDPPPEGHLLPTH